MDKKTVSMPLLEFKSYTPPDNFGPETELTLIVGAGSAYNLETIAQKFDMFLRASGYVYRGAMIYKEEDNV